MGFDTRPVSGGKGSSLAAVELTNEDLMKRYCALAFGLDLGWAEAVGITDRGKASRRPFEIGFLTWDIPGTAPNDHNGAMSPFHALGLEA